MSFRMSAAALLCAALSAGSAADAYADGTRVAPVGDPLTQKVCGECHLAFPPAFLPARSWAALVDGQADHFGEDLGLSADEAAHIKAYLAGRAGDTTQGGGAQKFMRQVAPNGTPMRITENPAFLRKHNFSDRVWADPKVLTKSNCQACHAGAAQGWFDDD